MKVKQTKSVEETALLFDSLPQRAKSGIVALFMKEEETVRARFRYILAKAVEEVFGNEVFGPDPNEDALELERAVTRLHDEWRNQLVNRQ